MQRSNAAVNLNICSNPWDQPPAQLWATLRTWLPSECLAVALLSPEAPQLDEFLFVHGWTTPELSAWCQANFQNDKLLRSAVRTGSAQGARAMEESSLAKYAHTMFLSIPESSFSSQIWFLALTRKNNPFSTRERSLAELILRHWQAQLSLPCEPGMMRLLVGNDQRLIASDLATQAKILDKPNLCDQLVSSLPAILEQRYPNLTDHTTHDMAVSLDNQTQWACVRRTKAVDSPKAEHWLIELRPMDPTDLPPLGLLHDERIAQAIAYIHEHYHRAPSLADIAKTVHISPFHFHRLFTKLVGISPKHYLQRKQLQMAKWFLRQGGISIGQIAKRTGFSSHGHFTSTFRKAVKQSPTQYRDRPS